MKRRTVLLVALALTLLVSGIVLAQGGGGNPVAAQSGAATLSGGRYRLVSVSVQAGVIASGGGYRLLGPASPSGGNQCCCTYLPCILRNYP
jgi:hypothetical protein